MSKYFTAFFATAALLFSQQNAAVAQAINEAQLLEYYQSQRYIEAAAYLKKAYAEPVTDAVALSRLAYASLMAGQLPDAESYYQRAYDMDTTRTSILNSLAGINMRRGNLPRAEKFYTRITRTDTSNFYVYTQLAKLNMYKGDTAGYTNCLERANRLNPVDADVASDLSNVYIGNKQYARAETVLNKAIVTDPENVVLLQSLLHLTHAQTKWPETVKTGLKLLQLGDESYLTSLKLAQAYYVTKDYNCCLEILAAMRPDIQNETSFYYMGLACKAQKKYAQAVAYFEKAVKDGISPAIAAYYGEIAGSYQESKKFGQAAVNYEKGLQFKELPLLLYSLATLYDDDLKNKSKALRYYKKYLATNPPAKQQVYVNYSKSRVSSLAAGR